MKRRGFTIVELIIVITIMGILLVLGVANLRGSQVSARDSERKTDVETIAMNLENFYISGSDSSTIINRYPSTVFTNTSGGLAIKVLVVGGGGGGGAFGGGGGGGGMIYSSSFAISSQSYTVTVGNGGSGAPTYSAGGTGTNGYNSSLGSLVAYGGGGGGTRLCSASCIGINGASGGSGGGGSPADSGSIGYGGISSQSGQGYSGGTGAVYGWGGAGGGGAGGVGSDATSGVPSVGGNGGIGLSSSISGNTAYYSGGGGGCAHDTGTPGTGGNGGGGNGAKASGIGHGANGISYTGGGGGGGSAGSYVGGNGGSGIVIISYPTGSVTATGGAITYTDSNNANPRSVTPYTGGNTIHTFTSSGTFTVTSFATSDIKLALRDIDVSSLKAPGITDIAQTFIAATNNIQTIAGVTPQPTINQYVYQPLQSDGTLCTTETQDCRKFNIYYRLETDGLVHMITGRRQ